MTPTDAITDDLTPTERQAIHAQHLIAEIEVRDAELFWTVGDNSALRSLLTRALPHLPAMLAAEVSAKLRSTSAHL